MPIMYCSAKRFKQIITAGAEWVTKNRDQLNRINVFPVPDGDTGSNMSSTLISAVREMDALKEVSLETTAKAAAWGALMGARGNSGIIMAQILAGIAESIEEGQSKLFAADIAAAFSRAAVKARKAVLHPTEGTILTVIREAAESAEHIALEGNDLAVFLEGMTQTARVSVERTPLLLPKLKEAGVVDAGGQGFCYFLEGILRLVQGVTEEGIFQADETLADGMTDEAGEHHWNYRYCTEFILKGSQISEESVKNTLALMGDSLVVVGDTRLARIHIHTNRPEDVLKYASTLGQVSSIKVDDMLVQHTTRFQATTSSKSTSVVAVTLGDGFKELFYNAGAELVVDGGPTQNPSTADIVAAIEAVSSPDVIVLPNHNNIYPVTVQAKETTSKNVIVLKTSSTLAGLSAMFAYMDDAPVMENVERMEKVYMDIKTGEVARASRDARQGSVEVQTGDAIGIFNGKICCSHPDTETTVMELIKLMIDDTDEIVTLYYGESISKDEAENLQFRVKKQHADKEIEVYFGGQPYALYHISVE